MAYFLVRLFFLFFFKFYLGFRVEGKENIPRKGAFILAANHSSYLDPPLLAASINRSLYFMARGKLFLIPFIGWIIKHAHAFPVKRHDGDLNAFKTSLKALDEGNGLVIFPEGTRSKNKKLKPAKPGIGFLAHKARVPVIPAYIEGTFDAMPRKVSTLRRFPVRVYIGKPIDFTSYFSKKHSAGLYQQISDEVMREIAELKGI